MWPRGIVTPEKYSNFDAASCIIADASSVRFCNLSAKPVVALATSEAICAADFLLPPFFFADAELGAADFFSEPVPPLIGVAVAAAASSA